MKLSIIGGVILLLTLVDIIINIPHENEKTHPAIYTGWASSKWRWG